MGVIDDDCRFTLFGSFGLPDSLSGIPLELLAVHSQLTSSICRRRWKLNAIDHLTQERRAEGEPMYVYMLRKES
jgi:hypothetical protein